MAGKEGQKKRFLSDEEKVSICLQTCTPERSIEDHLVGPTRGEPVTGPSGSAGRSAEPNRVYQRAKSSEGTLWNRDTLGTVFRQRCAHVRCAWSWGMKRITYHGRGRLPRFQRSLDAAVIGYISPATAERNFYNAELAAKMY